MHFSHSLPETQAALALAIFLATFIYEDGATLLAATVSASGALDPRLGLLTTFLGIWMGDMGLYGLGSSFGRRTAQSRWLQKYLRPESLVKAEQWLAKNGSFALIMSRAIPGSRLPLYLAAGALRLPSTVVCADYRIVFGCLGLRDLCHVAIHSQSAVGVSEVVALAGDCTYAVRPMVAGQERHLDSRQDSES